MERKEIIERLNELVITEKIYKSTEFRKIIHEKVDQLMNFYCYLNDEGIVGDSFYRFYSAKEVKELYKSSFNKVQRRKFNRSYDINNLTNKWYHLDIGIDDWAIGDIFEFSPCDSKIYKSRIYEYYNGLIGNMVDDLGLS